MLLNHFDVCTFDSMHIAENGKNNHEKMKGGSHGAVTDARPLSVHPFYHFHAVFDKKKCQIIGWCSLGLMPSLWEIVDQPLAVVHPQKRHSGALSEVAHLFT